MSGQYRVLLVESDEASMDVLKKVIEADFPSVNLECTHSPGAAIELLEQNSYDILICDAYLRHDECVCFIGDLCREKGLFLVVITGDTDIKTETFSPHITAVCVHDILYKPLDLMALRKSVQCAIQRVKTRKTKPK